MKTMKTLLCVVLLLSIGFAEDAVRDVTKRVEPQYPELAQKMNLHGTVKLKVWIAPDGAVRRVEYIGGHPLLAESAVSTVKQWKFQNAPKETAQTLELKF